MRRTAIAAPCPNRHSPLSLPPASRAAPRPAPPRSHQNRDNRGLRGRTGNTGMEAILPSFLDLVIWGHEHQCIPEVGAAQGRSEADRATRVLQPGSTVATSLCEGEAARKHLFRLEVLGSKFRTTPIALRCVRPFAVREVELGKSQIDPAGADADKQVLQLLRETVEDMLAGLERGHRALPPNEQAPVAMRLPLVRLKVREAAGRGGAGRGGAHRRGAIDWLGGGARARARVSTRKRRCACPPARPLSP